MPPPGNDALPACRSILFVPGDRPDRYDKALAAGADAVCIDLEDAVPPGRKDEARKSVARFLSESEAGSGKEDRATEPSSPTPVIVRVNDPVGGEGESDADILADCPPPQAFMIPKVKGAADVQVAARALSAAPLLVLIETARGLENAVEIVACDGVAGVIFGGFDLAIELGAEPRWEALLYARSRVVHAAALSALDAIDMPSRDFREMSGLREEAVWARRLGFAGKAAIHPAQIPVIHEIFVPSADEVRRASRILEADRAAGGSAVALDGSMVDRPVVEAARRIIQRARPGSTP